MASPSAFPPLPDGLPPGRLIVPEDFRVPPQWVGKEILWVSDEPLPDADHLWARLYGAHTETGLYPLLLCGHFRDADRPWHAGELGYWPVGTIDVLGAEGVLRRMWESVTPDEFGEWRGLAPPAGSSGHGADLMDPGLAAQELAASYAAKEHPLIGLVPAGRGADALTLCGWNGPLNHTNHTQEISAVVRTWEDRFGARVVAVGFDTLHVSVAAPPLTLEHARHLADEHLAFCPDNIGDDFERYAAGLVGARQWSFWWD
ncbi:DUF4253 domain-containing protein [Actinomadura rudentiformis]|uniref:DUF4253 domain-containing protein n=1 Tax=Actinomadura rudentiformis TaxID=359158 RepID=A0A6H9YIM4_9ACTN|nr:DUF4253 domain-containing protein [Actinomadura rudentiformis]KAB2342406.1 DUF4253 domain-containing protein [Actinomadura rudentiformis]